MSYKCKLYYCNMEENCTKIFNSAIGLSLLLSYSLQTEKLLISEG